MIAYNWIAFVRCYGKYFLRYIWTFGRNRYGKDDVELYKLCCRLIDMCRDLCRHAFSMAQLDQLELDVKTTMEQFYKLAPNSQHVIIIHLFHHLIQQLTDYGPARSWWAFHTERFFGVLARAMKKRNDKEATMFGAWRCILNISTIDVDALPGKAHGSKEAHGDCLVDLSSVCHRIVINLSLDCVCLWPLCG